MTTSRYWPDDGTPLTLEEHRALNLARPRTDPPIGGMTGRRRDMCAAASAVFTEPDNPVTAYLNRKDVA